VINNGSHTEAGIGVKWPIGVMTGSFSISVGQEVSELLWMISTHWDLRCQDKAATKLSESGGIKREKTVRPPAYNKPST
jgi:hypothetical protein